MNLGPDTCKAHVVPPSYDTLANLKLKFYEAGIKGFFFKLCPLYPTKLDVL